MESIIRRGLIPVPRTSDQRSRVSNFRSKPWFSCPNRKLLHIKDSCLGELCVRMPRSLVLVFFLLLLAFTSQFEWKQRILNGVAASPRILQMQRQIQRKEFIKEKIILSQEKSIRKLSDLVRSLTEQLLQCKYKFEVVNNTAVPWTELLNELEQQEIPEVD